MTEQGEGRMPQVIEIEAPEFLEEGQNLYDQEPFSTVVQQVSEEFGLETDGIREFLSNAGWGVGLSSEWDRGRIIGPIGSVAHRLSEQLKQYPYWEAYVEQKMGEYVYKRDGSYRPRARKFRYIPTTSYASWLQIKLRADRHQRLWGIQEVFPEADAIDVAREMGKRAANRKWRILRVGEFTK